jgi:PAS domain S-box-containing protein
MNCVNLQASFHLTPSISKTKKTTTMADYGNYKRFLFSPLDAGSGSYESVQKKGNGRISSEHAANIEELKKVNEELRKARRAALNLMEDAILSKNALAKSEEKYRMLFESIDEGFCVIEMIYDEARNPIDWLYLEENPAFVRLSNGLSAVGKKGSELLAKAEESWLQFFDSVVRTGESKRTENRSNACNRWYSVYCSPIAPGSHRVAIVFDDITQRKTAEIALGESDEKKAFLLKLSDALRPVSNPISTHEIVTRLTMERFAADRCYYSEIVGNLSIIRRDASKDGLPSVAGEYLLDNIPILKSVIDAGKSFVVYDVNTTNLVDESLRQLCNELKLISFVDVPVIKNGVPVGVLCIVQSAPRSWTKFEIELAEEVAERTSSAIERSKAEEGLRVSEERKEFLLKLNDALRQLNDRVNIQYEASRLVAEQLEADRVYFAVIGDDEELVIGKDFVRGNAPSVAGAFKPQDIAAALKLRWNEPVVIADTQLFSLLTDEEKASFAAAKIRSQLSVALSKKDRKVASFAVDQTTPRQWTPLEISILQDAAERTWEAVERAMAEEALRETQALIAKELEDTRKLQKISSRIIEKGDVNALYEALIDSATDIMHSDFASIQVLDSTTNQLLLHAWKGFHPKSAKYWKYIDASSSTSCGQALKQRARIVVPDVESYSGISKEDLHEYRRSGVVAMQSTPLISRLGNCVGMISTHWKQVHQPSERELSLFEVVARQAADLIEGKQAEDAVRESEERLRTLADSIPQVIWGNNAQGKANYFNQRWYDYSGLNYEQSAGAGWEAIVHPEDAPASVEKWRQALAAGEVFDTEYRLRRHDGSYRWFIGRNVPLKDDAGKVTGWFGSATDIEELKKTAEALSSSEARLKITMESATDYAIITMDTERRIERWSGGATQIFNWTEAEVIGQSGDIIFTQEDRLAGAPEKEMETARDEGRAIDERWHVAKDGSKFFMSGVMRPIYNPALTGYVKVARDMTEQQLFTEELHRLVAERTAELQRSNDDLRQFAHVASHDLREPVRKIKTFNTRIIDDFSEVLPDKVKTYLNKIDSSANRMYAMIEGVLNYSKAGSEQQPVEAVDLNEIIRDIETDLEVLVQQKNAKVTPANLPTLHGYRVLLYQLFYNLILNSLKFAKSSAPSLINISCNVVNQDKEKFYKIVVSDNGIGFEPEYAEDIFSTFTRLNPVDEYQGSGLGLALCKKIVDRHKGTISAAGEPGKGASFTIMLPAK